MNQDNFIQENESITNIDHNQIRYEKLNAPRKRKHFHIPRYFIVVIWGLFMTFVVYSYAVITLNELDLYAKDFESAPVTVKVPITIEFLPNEPEPRLAPSPLF